MSSRPTVVAVHCPLWHNYDHASSWKGEGWCEWELLRTATPRYPGHRQPIVPAWGYFDESDPQWVAREIDLAADHGIDVFFFDWYWYSGVKIMEEALERGFLKAPNRNRLQFTIMFTNHDWNDYFPAPFDQPWNMWLPSRPTRRDLDRWIDYCAEHYFSQPNYWKVNGKLFVSIWQPAHFIEAQGGAQAARKALTEVDSRLARAGLPGIHWNAMLYDPAVAKAARDVGFHTATSYNVIDSGKTSPNLTQRYEDLMDAHEVKWQEMAAAGLPFAPVVTMGWDVTPRCLKSLPWPFPPAAKSGKHQYPYIHVVEGNTPQLFGELCRRGRRFAEQNQGGLNMVLVNAWNEWTEGCYLLPDTQHGTAYLEQLRDAFK